MKKNNIILFLAFIVSSSFSQDRPNILWITIEDTSPQFIGSYGNQDARTPYIDKLAKNGVLFKNAFSTNTVCSPSRTTLITGVRTYATGAGNHRSKYPLPNFMHGFPYYMQQVGYYTTNNSKTDYNVAKERSFIDQAWDESSDSASWTNRKPGQPFFAVHNFMDSHQSRTMTSPYEQYKKMVLDQLPQEDHINENEFDLPPFYRDSPEMRKQFARVYNAIKLTDNKIGELLKSLEKDNLMDSTIIFFYGDHGEGIPRGKTNGISLGYRVPFVIWFPPMYEHLSPWGSGIVSDELIDFEDLAPTLISLAGGQVPQYMKGRVLIGKDRSNQADHIELSSDRSDNGIDMIRSITDGRYIYSRNYLPFMPELRFINYMEIGEIKKIMRTDLAANKLNPLQKSLFEERPAEFLYDTNKDPWETDNLADKPEFKNILLNMRRQLDESILASRDVMFLPEYELELISQHTNLYEYRLDNKNYPLEEIYSAASLSGMRGNQVAQKQVALLNSKNKIVRYWAITGLRSQAPETLAPFSHAIIQALNDPYPPVGITASAVAYDVFSNKLAQEKLNQYALNTNDKLALLTLNYLLYVGNKQPFIATIQKLSKKKGLKENIEWACSDFLLELKELD